MKLDNSKVQNTFFYSFFAQRQNRFVNKRLFKSSALQAAPMW